jgi:drug/metabolite transporter, DME family
LVSREQSYGSGVVFVLLATVGWSLSGLFVRLMPGLDGWQINCWRGYWTAIALLVYLILTYGRGIRQKFDEIPRSALLISSLFFAFGTTLYVSSLTMVSTATVSVIGATSPLFAALLSPWITRERASFEAWIAACLAIAGVYIIAREEFIAGYWLGMILALGVPISFAGQTLALRRYRDVDMVPSFCLGGIFSFIFAGVLGINGVMSFLTFGKIDFIVGHAGGGFNVSLREIMLLAAMGTVQLAIPLVFYVRGSKSVQAVTLTLISMLDAVINPLWPWIFVGEKPSRSSFVGGTIVIGAVLISIFGRKFFQSVFTKKALEFSDSRA